jgi:hypothetical protein
MKDNWVKNGLVVSIILLFIGVAVAPSINSTVVKASTDDDLVEVTSSRLGNCDVRMSFAHGMKAGKQSKSFQSVSPDGVTMFQGNHSAVASDTFGNVIMGFETLTTNEAWFASSEDFGNTWSVDFALADSGGYPDVDSCGDGRFIGGMLPSPENSGVLWWMRLEPNYYDIGCWDYSADGYTNIKSVAVAGFPDHMYGSQALVCDKDFGGAVGVPLYICEGYYYESGYKLYQIEGLHGCKIAANDIDLVTQISYGVWNYNNSGNMDLYFYKLDFGTWVPSGDHMIHPEIGSGIITRPGNEEYLDVSAYNDNVIIVAQRDDEIVAYYSTNGMHSFHEALIDSDAGNPRVVHHGNNSATCIFSKESSVYYSRTTDGGSTWSLPTKVDDANNVSEGYKRSDVCSCGASWTNTTDEYIYFHGISGKPKAPVIDGQTSGKKGKNYSYTFAARDPDGDDVSYYIDWGDGTHEEWIGPYASEEKINVSHTWNEKGTYTLKAKARDTFGDESDWATLTVTMPLSYEPPHLHLFEWLFARFPHTFPIPRHMLGFYQ